MTVNSKPLKADDSPAITAGRSLNYMSDLVRMSVSTAEAAGNRLNQQTEMTDYDSWEQVKDLAKYEAAANEAKAVALHATHKLDWETQKLWNTFRCPDRPPVTPWIHDPKGWIRIFRQNKPKGY